MVEHLLRKQKVASSNLVCPTKIASWCNGSTTVFGSVGLSSNLGGATIIETAMEKIYLGMDPGCKGALSIIYQDGTIESFSFVHFSWQEICRELSVANDKGVCYAVVEDVHSVFGSSAKSTFEFGYNKGILVGILTALQIPYSMIPPKTWQNGVWERCDKVMDGTKVKTKETSINCAQRIFPDVDLRLSERGKKPDDGICDSLLMAEYARRNNL